MKCDADSACRIEPHRGIRLLIPHRFQMGQERLPPRRVMTPFHFCEQHRVTADEAKLVAALLTRDVIRDVEAAAKIKWPLGYKCDFDNTTIDWVLVTTPEYRAFLAALGHHGVMGAAKLAPEQQRALAQRLGTVKVAGG